MKTKLRRNTQISLINLKGAGRPAIHDAGIRHLTRPFLKKASSLHLTVKIKKIKAEMKNKFVLSILNASNFECQKARTQSDSLFTGI